MGMRSMNALVVKAGYAGGHKVPDEVAKQLSAVAHCAIAAEGMLWVWETNISPLWARHGVADLQEEVVILGWLLTLPRADFQIIRCGEELGCLGEWSDHPFRRDLNEEYMRVAGEYADQNLEATPDAEGRLWSRGHPEHIGWYLANPTRTSLAWRFWDGKNWSVTGLRGLTAAQAAEVAKQSECASAERMMWWSDYWPEGLPLNRTLPPPAEKEPASC